MTDVIKYGDVSLPKQIHTIHAHLVQHRVVILTNQLTCSKIL